MQGNPADKGKFSSKIITKTTVQTQTTSLKKQKLQRSPIHPPTFKINNLRKNQTSNPEPDKAEHSPQSKRDHAPTSSSRERLKLSNLPSQPTETSKIDTKNRFSWKQISKALKINLKKNNNSNSTWLTSTLNNEITK